MVFESLQVGAIRSSSDSLKGVQLEMFLNRQGSVVRGFSSLEKLQMEIYNEPPLCTTVVFFNYKFNDFYSPQVSGIGGFLKASWGIFLKLHGGAVGDFCKASTKRSWGFFQQSQKGANGGFSRASTGCKWRLLMMTLSLPNIHDVPTPTS